MVKPPSVPTAVLSARPSCLLPDMTRLDRRGIVLDCGCPFGKIGAPGKSVIMPCVQSGKHCLAGEVMSWHLHVTTCRRHSWLYSCVSTAHPIPVL